MIPILILRTEIVCFILLLFLLLASKLFYIGKETGFVFKKLVIFALIFVAFDGITVWTVNNMDIVPEWVNYAAHIVYYVAGVLYSKEILQYVASKFYPRASKQLFWWGFIPIIIFLALIPFPFMHIQYENFGGVYSSTGTPMYVGFALSFVFIIASMVLIILNRKTISRRIKFLVLPMILLVCVTSALQAFFKPLLFTGAAITILTIAFFLSLENPVHAFKQKLYLDALTGMGSSHGYAEELDRLEAVFASNPESARITVVFCDINNLRAVNNRYGHQEGDRYILLVASALGREITSSDKIFRIGGDEFVIFFKNVPEGEVVNEIRNVQNKVASANVDGKYVPAIAAGYAVSGKEYKNVKDVIKAADYAMYINKAELKEGKNDIVGATSIKTNVSGLTNSLFDALCLIDDKESYPYILNLETFITRISPGFKIKLGLEDVFIKNFIRTLVDIIHPDDVSQFVEDFSLIAKGRVETCDYSFRVKTMDEGYVKCVCRGARLKRGEDFPDIFAGYFLFEPRKTNDKAE